jgi:hypothetical protein
MKIRLALSLTRSTTHCRPVQVLSLDVSAMSLCVEENDEEEASNEEAVLWDKTSQQ